MKQEFANIARFTGTVMFNEFVNNMEKSTPVESNLDLFYRD